MCVAERLESELAKSEPKGQSQMAKTRESKSEGIENHNGRNKGLQKINYDI